MNGSMCIGPLAVLSLLGSLACPGCKSIGAGTRSARAAIDAGNSRFSEAFRLGDADAVAALYTPDAIVFPPGGEMVRGRKAIGEFWRATRESGIESATLTTVDVGESGDLAYEVGTALLTIRTQGKESTTDFVKYVVVWKRETDGSWRLHRDIWNDLPPAK